MTPIARGPFFWWSVLVFWIPTLTAIALGLAAGVYDRLVGSSHGATPALGAMALLAVLSIGVACVVAMLWLVARRARTVGWSPLVTLILFVPLSALVWLALLLKDEQGVD